MYATLVSGMGHCIQPIYRTLVAIEASWSRRGPGRAAAAVQVLCKYVRQLGLTVRCSQPRTYISARFWLISSCLKCSSTDWLILSYSLRRTRFRRYGKRTFLLSHNVWPSCCVTLPQFCHNAWWCWRNTADLMH